MLSRLLLILGITTMVTTITIVILQPALPLPDRTMPLPFEDGSLQPPALEENPNLEPPTEVPAPIPSLEETVPVEGEQTFFAVPPVEQRTLPDESSAQQTSSPSPTPEHPSPQEESVMIPSAPTTPLPQESLQPPPEPKAEEMRAAEQSPSSEPSPLPHFPPGTDQPPTPPSPNDFTMQPYQEPFDSSAPVTAWCCTDGECISSLGGPCQQRFDSPVACMRSCFETQHASTVWCCSNECSAPLSIGTCDEGLMYATQYNCQMDCLPDSEQEFGFICPVGCVDLADGQECEMGRRIPINTQNTQAGFFSRFLRFHAQLTTQEKEQHICCCPLSVQN